MKIDVKAMKRVSQKSRGSGLLREIWLNFNVILHEPFSYYRLGLNLRDIIPWY